MSDADSLLARLLLVADVDAKKPRRLIAAPTGGSTAVDVDGVACVLWTTRLDSDSIVAVVVDVAVQLEVCNSGASSSTTFGSTVCR